MSFRALKQREESGWGHDSRFRSCVPAHGISNFEIRNSSFESQSPGFRAVLAARNDLFNELGERLLDDEARIRIHDEIAQRGHRSVGCGEQAIARDVVAHIRQPASCGIAQHGAAQVDGVADVNVLGDGSC